MNQHSSDHTPHLETLNMIPGYQIQSNIPQLAQQIFSIPPGLPNSIGLQLETDDVQHSGRNPEQAQTIVDILSHILLYGIRVKYGKDQDPKQLNQSQIYEIRTYMRSIGFDIILTSYTLDEEMNDPEGYTPIDIEFYRLRMIDSEKNIWHDIKITPYREMANTLTTQLL